jgi:hypothetical protein
LPNGVSGLKFPAACRAWNPSGRRLGAPIVSSRRRFQPNSGAFPGVVQRLRAYREEAGVDWVQFESPHSIDEIKAARAAITGPFSFMKGKLGRYPGHGGGQEIHSRRPQSTPGRQFKIAGFPRAGGVNYDRRDRVEFAPDSPLEEAGFEPSVPRKKDDDFETGTNSPPINLGGDGGLNAVLPMINVWATLVPHNESYIDRRSF